MSKTTAALKLAEEALNAMLTHMGMDEDEWTKPTFDQSRKTLAAIREVLAMTDKTTEAFDAWWADEGEQSLYALNTTTDDDIKILAGIAWEAAIREALAEPVKQEPVVHYKKALDAWFEKTEWVQETAKPKELGMHRADVLKQRINELEKQIAAPVSAKSEWVELEPWQLCEIEERIGLPIDSHDFETIGNAYIAAFKDKNR